MDEEEEGDGQQVDFGGEQEKGAEEDG